MGLDVRGRLGDVFHLQIAQCSDISLPRGTAHEDTFQFVPYLDWSTGVTPGLILHGGVRLRADSLGQGRPPGRHGSAWLRGGLTRDRD